MTLKKMNKWFGILVLLAGILRIGMTPSALIWGTDSPQELYFGLSACILMAVSSIGLFLVQRESGVSGFISSLLMSMGNVVAGCLVWFLLGAGMVGEEAKAITDPNVLMVSSIIMMLGMFIGTPLFTYATFRAKVFPRWVFYLLLLSMVGPVIPGLEEWGALFWGLSYVGMGFVMITEKYAKTQTLENPLTF